MTNEARQVVLDTETTGLDPQQGDRIVEIGCVEIVDMVPTGKTYQVYINPERAMDESAKKITGLTNEKLKDCPVFADIAHEFAEFIGDAPLVIHNAPFDVGFIDSEFERVGLEPLNPDRVVDTLTIARNKFPGQPNSLDALCGRLGVDNSNRTYHGALLDAELLTEVYAELLGGRQRGLGFADDEQDMGASALAAQALAADLRPTGIQRPARPHTATPDEIEAHSAFLKERVTDPIWHKTEVKVSKRTQN